jgi:SAM-dependent methyltransferase
MAVRDAREDWRLFDVGSIPTKASTPHLDRFLAGLPPAAADRAPPALLDVGCGDGRLGKRLYERGFSVTGVDISPDAVLAARALAVSAEVPGRSLRFHEADFAADLPSRIEGGPFDIVVCQLVVSIIGDVRNRRNLLRHMWHNLRPGGWLYLSASGVSDTINPGYARLYADDASQTGEQHSYFSRDEDGGVLYMTHHFTVEELLDLIQSEGFVEINVKQELEVSSRRPDEAAYFLYATCQSPESRG